MSKYSNISKILALFIVLWVVNFISSAIYKRFDLTEDGRYTLSQPAITILEKVDTRLLINVYLEGEFPSEFRRLQDETEQLLEELKVENPKIRFRFLDPLENDPEALIKKGLQPSQLSIQKNGSTSEILIFPWATVKNGSKTEKVSLLKDTNAQSQDEQLQNAIQNLEYAFVDAIHKVTSKKEKKIAILKGNGELEDIYIADFLRKIGEYYHLAPFTLDKVETSPTLTVKHLKEYDLAIIAKPSERFTDEEIFTLDQFVMGGGNTLWLVDQVQAELDSLMTTGESLAYTRDLNLTSLLFSYGVRINRDLVQDLYSSKIPIASGNIGNKTQFNQFLWSYYPLTQTTNNHAINSNIEPVSFKFSNSIELLKNNIQKTVLLQSSPLSRTVGSPTIITLKSIAEKPDPANYTQGNLPMAVLLEGTFKSAYANRIHPFKLDALKTSPENHKMIVISDGDLIANQVTRGQPEKLGVDRLTGQQFGNKEFLLNCVSYLLDDSRLIQIRSKTIDLKTLDREKSFQKKSLYQLLNVITPLILLALFGIGFHQIRKKKYQ